VIFTRRPLDREALSHYTLHVHARSDDVTSGDSADDVTVVFIRVVDVNDHAPEVVYPLPGNEIHIGRGAVGPGSAF